MTNEFFASKPNVKENQLWLELKELSLFFVLCNSLIAENLIKHDFTAVDNKTLF